MNKKQGKGMQHGRNENEKFEEERKKFEAEKKQFEEGSRKKLQPV